MRRVITSLFPVTSPGNGMFTLIMNVSLKPRVVLTSIEVRYFSHHITVYSDLSKGDLSSHCFDIMTAIRHAPRFLYLMG